MSDRFVRIDVEPELVPSVSDASSFGARNLVATPRSEDNIFRLRLVCHRVNGSATMWYNILPGDLRFFHLPKSNNETNARNLTISQIQYLEIFGASKPDTRPGKQFVVRHLSQFYE